MMTSMKNRIAIPTPLATIAAVCCLALAWADHDTDTNTQLASVTAAPEQVIEAEEAEQKQASEPRAYFRLPDLTFLLLPGNRAR